MNKKTSKIILFTTMGLIIMSTIALGVNIKDDYGLEDISGSKESLDNVNIVYQKKVGAYRTKEVKLSKDETVVSEFDKAADLHLPFTKLYKEERDFYSESLSRTKYNYEYEDIIGFLNTERIYGDKLLDLEFKVKEKNIKTNKENEYRLNISEKNVDGKYSAWPGMPIKYNGELYASVIWTDEAVESVYSANKETWINIYKLDLDNEEVELIDSIEFKNKDELKKLGYPSFTYNNKFYIAKDTYDNTGVGETKVARSFITYDLETKKFDSIDMTKNVSPGQNYSMDNIEGRVAYISSFNERYDERTLSISTLNLESDKFIKENEIYNIEIPEEGYDYSLLDIRCVNGKLYAVINGYEKPDLEEGREQYNKNYVYVIDENTKEVLYIGLIKEKLNADINLDIVLDEEL